MNPDFATQVRQQKALARRNQTKRNQVWLVGVLFGVATSGAWFLLSPTEGPSPQAKFVIGVIVGSLFAALYLVTQQSSLFPKEAACPVCGHSWEIKEGRFVPPQAQMPNWDKCPGCG